jgi:hypothetical protein
VSEDDRGPFLDLLAFLVLIGVFCLIVGAFLAVADLVERYVLPALAPYPVWVLLIGAGSALLLLAASLAWLSLVVDRLPTISVEVRDDAQ